LTSLTAGVRPISLHDIARHNCIEHDASIVHVNTHPDHKFAPIHTDPVLLEGFLDESHISLQSVAERRVELEDVSPLDIMHQEIAIGEWALVLDIFGKRDKGKIAAGFLRAWLEENRFAEDWMPSHQQSLLATMYRAFTIRLRMNSFRKYYLTLPEEKRGKKKLAEQLNAEYKCGALHGCH
jgi:hypothetical protein